LVLQVTNTHRGGIGVLFNRVLGVHVQARQVVAAHVQDALDLRVLEEVVEDGALQAAW
jgi:hypothetical protein